MQVEKSSDNTKTEGSKRKDLCIQLHKNEKQKRYRMVKKTNTINNQKTTNWKKIIGKITQIKH